MYTALTRVPLADATAAQFFAPVLVTVLSVPFLAERVRPSRMAAVAIAFAAVLVIIRPGASSDPYLLLAPASVLSPFLYSQILFAAVLSVFVFGDPLTVYTLAGALLLVASGIYLWRSA